MSVVEHLQEIHDRHGEITPELVLAEASDPRHPLHDRFEWDDSEAARQFRLVQASMLLRVKVWRQPTPDAKPVQVRAFIAQRDVIAEEEDDLTAGRYLPIDDVLSSDVLRSAWFRQMQSDWLRLKRKYEVHKEFAQMVMDDLRSEAG